ncbi:MAG: exodeoxyribonuclease VII large subunit [Alphaproteobacteria bacterium]|nr:exodeoxyribonuclease VII large subunit [Alphaproteobacteria bacterium]
MTDETAQLKEFTVSEISFEIKRFVETTFNRVRVKGEIFGGKVADSGHYYLSLKDDNATLSAVCWKGTMNRLPFKPEDGMEVIVSGKITTFAGKSSYQIIIESMEIAGTGALLKLLEERKQKFMAEGLFDQRHKKSVPFLPEKIGVITSASGAVIRDIIHRVRDRFPSHILLWPTPVQGEGSAEKIAAAIEGFNALPKSHKPDVLIVARGGGSLEDLWAFNEEIVIRAVFASQIPIISAVGHETDTMLIDYVSDLRAPTPTGAAEFAVPVKNELALQISNLENRLKNASHRFFMEKKNYLEALSRGIPNLSQILFEANQKLDDRIERLKVSFKNYLNQKQNLILQTKLSPYYISNIFEKKKENLSNLVIRLENVSIDSVLNRGFAWVKTKNNKTIYNAEAAQKNQFLEIKFIDGEVKTKVVSKKDEAQGDLFNF